MAFAQMARMRFSRLSIVLRGSCPNTPTVAASFARGNLQKIIAVQRGETFDQKLTFF
jgi:hypothetical protein